MLYFHSHGSNRQEGRFLLKFAARMDYNLCLVDSRGSGVSEGQFCTLGIRESRDIHSLVKHLQRLYRVETVLLYGRSMGAVSIMKFVSEFRRGRPHQTSPCPGSLGPSSTRPSGPSSASSTTS